MEVLRANGKLKIVLEIILYQNRVYQIYWYMKYEYYNILNNIVVLYIFSIY